MKNNYTGEIDKNTAWDGDESTGGLPVAGTSIETFLKRNLDSKAGCFHYDTGNNRYLVFADEAARDAYLENPQDNGDLLIAFFDAPFNYSAEIHLETPQFNAVLSESTGNCIAFTFDTKNKSGQSVGEDVVCTFTFVRGSVRKTVTQKYRAGASVRFQIDDYIETGTNNVSIAIVGQNTLAATTIGVTYQVIDLRLSDSFDISRLHDLSAVSQIEVPFSISGYGAKTMEWYLDGELLPFVRTEDEITEAETTRTKYIPIEGLTQGTHHVQFRASTVINGEKFYSKTLYREFIVYTRADKDPITSIGTEFPLGAPIVNADEPLKLRGLSQYLPYTLKLGLFNPTYATSTPLEIYLDDSLLTTLSMQNDKETEYELAVTSYGEKTLRLKTETTMREIPLQIERSSTSIEEITQGLSLALSATGKSNASTDKSTWRYGAYSTLFNGFKWLDNSGWNSGELIISGGASISINYAPFAGDVTSTGKTLEIEFSTRNVSDIDAPICDLRNANGVGLLITASEASLTSAGGARVSTRYKAGENVRLAFVVNKKSGAADKGLAMLYVNGILSGAANYAANDNFICAQTITMASSAEADIALRHIRIYDTALTGNQVLNNYILYRPTAEEFLRVYNRNNIYEEGTSDFSTDTLAGQLPIMIITGNIPALEATTDKNLQIDVDVEYINLQDQSLSFSVKDGAMRPQGTSSMSYPKKNCRLYTNKKDSTILYDADGNKVENRLYAFKKGAQPVYCWCFKADYAESSGTHNTGIARLWNDAMKNAQINGAYPCRTRAQQTAIDGGYPYDVRTAIDGFPILMFYRLTENDPLVFIGKYNFNNDKSTESVFGFCDIPGFDNSKVECWEVLNNGHHLALFQDTKNWAAEWDAAFEARYPDGSTNTTALKKLADWISTVTAENFSTEKYAHLDVYKVAAYYVYLMRFGAVDQVVKNAMLTTEDGEHWYYINYDNDTVNGLRNDGLLIYPPTIDRQSPDPTISGVYAYAGHDSRLWNMLEADAEFMQIVSEVDSALYSAGLSYANVVDIFDREQSGKWCERIYNQDAQYKYIGPYNDKGINNLFMLQGSRQSHRRWWLSERFSLLDAKFVSGEYKANSFEVKLAGAPIGLNFQVKAGMATNYGYGVNNVPIQYGIELAKGATHMFSTTSVLNVGDPLRIYAAPYIEAIDICNFAPYLTQISIANVYSDRLGTKLKTLVIGAHGAENNALTELSGINQATALEELNINGFKGVKTLDLSRNGQLKTLDARNSGLTSVILPVGAPVATLQLPSTLQALSLNGLYYLDNSGLTIQDNGCNLTTIDIKDCPELDTQSLVENWLIYKTEDDSMCSLSLSGIDWTGVDTEWLIALGRLRVLSLRGSIAINEADEEQLTRLQQLFGKNCFSQSSELYIKVPADAQMYFIGPDSVRALSTAQYEVVVTSAVEGEVALSMEGSASKVTFVDGYLTVGDIDTDTTITLSALFIPEEGLPFAKRKKVALQKINYPTTGTIEGPGETTKKGVLHYQVGLGSHDEDAKFYIVWELSGDAVTKGYALLGTTNDEEANIIINKLEESACTLSVKIYRSSDNKLLGTIKKTVDILVGDVIMTASSNPDIMKICYKNKWAAHSNYMTAVEAAMVTNIGTAFNSSISPNTTFNEFVHFVNAAPSFSFSSNIVEITCPWEEIDASATISAKICRFPYLKKIKSQVCFPHLETLDVPVLSELTEGGEFLFGKSVELVLPELIRIDTTACGFSGYSGAELSLNLPKLETWVNRSTYSVSINTLNAPILKTLRAYLNFNSETLSLPELKIWLTKLYGNVKKLYLPKLTHIGVYGEEDMENVPVIGPFSSCSNLKEIIGLENVECLYGRYIFSTSSVGSESFTLPEEVEFPKLRILRNSSSSYLTGVFTDKLKGISAPKLVDLYDNISSSNESLEYVKMPSIKTLGSVNFSNYTKLRQVDFASLEDAYGKFSNTALTELSLPNAKKFSISRCPNLESLSLDALEEASVPGLFLNNLPSLTLLKLPALKRLENTSGSYCLIVDCPSLESLNIPKCTYIDGGSNGAIKDSAIKTVKLSVTEPVSLYNLGFYGSTIETLEGFFSYIDKRGLNSKKLHTIKMLAPSEPTMNSASNSSDSGTEVPEGVEKTIHIRVDAEGFGHDSLWVTKFAKPCGFTIVRDIPAPENE